jgi:hypothetical protein
MDWVHEWWTTAESLGPLWTGGGTDWRASGRGDALTGVGPMATPEHGRSPERVVNGGWSTGIPLRALPELGRWCGSWAMVTNWWWRRNSVAIVDISYAAPQAHGIVNVALHREYSPGIVFIFYQGRKDLYHV